MSPVHTGACVAHVLLPVFVQSLSDSRASSFRHSVNKHRYGFAPYKPEGGK